MEELDMLKALAEARLFLSSPFLRGGLLAEAARSSATVSPPSDAKSSTSDPSSSSNSSSESLAPEVLNLATCVAYVDEGSIPCKAAGTAAGSR